MYCMQIKLIINKKKEVYMVGTSTVIEMSYDP